MGTVRESIDEKICGRVTQKMLRLRHPLGPHDATAFDPEGFGLVAETLMDCRPLRITAAQDASGWQKNPEG